MKKELARRLISHIFLFIFFAKMVISVAPLIAIHLDSEVVNAVIMQLENHSSQGTDQVKDSINKGVLLSGFSKFKFCSPQVDTTLIQYILLRNQPIQAFYPSVPTPPPNC